MNYVKSLGPNMLNNTNIKLMSVNKADRNIQNSIITW